MVHGPPKDRALLTGSPTIAGMNAMCPPYDIADPAAVVDGLSERLPHFGDIRWVQATGSTNADLLARARSADEPPRPWLLGTHLQQAGRGRAGRPWRSAVGECLTVSCAFDVDMPARHLPSLSPLAGLAACEALRALAPDNARSTVVKWPNDLQLGDKKLGGILVESVRRPGARHYTVVIGMGMNLHNAAALSHALGRDVSDWSEVTGKPCETQTVVILASTLARAWGDMIEALSRSSFAAFSARYAAVDALSGRTVDVTDQGRILFSGMADGCDEAGRLRVVTSEGVQPVAVGDVSVRARS